MQKKGLGKGLSSLIPNAQKEAEDKIYDSEGVLTLKLNDIEPNRDQPRKNFDEEALLTLSDSISKYGVIQPLIVRNNDGYYELVAGERRWRAARLAGLTEVPVIVKDYDELKSTEIALIENIQRENLNSVEEANAYKRLQDEFNLTQDQIADRVGKKRSTIANSLRILNLSDKVKVLLENNKITAGHAKALLSIDDKMVQDNIADKIVNSDLSVRQVEEITKKLSLEKKKNKAENSDDALNQTRNLIYYKSVERELHGILGTKVKVVNGKNKGKIEIEYFTDDDLNRLLEIFKRKEA